MSARRRPILCTVLDGTALGEAPGRFAQALFEAGVDWIQLRDRALEAGPLFAIARALVGARDAVRAGDSDPERRVGGAHVPRVVVNKRGDVALAAGADGVHLGVDALDPGSVRTLASIARGDGSVDDAARGVPRIGASLHAPAELEARIGAGEPLDYVHLAPIWSPRSKPAERPELGLASLAEAARIGARAGILVLAQGGLDATRAALAVAAGAGGIAVTGVVRGATDPLAEARALRLALDRPASDEAGTPGPTPGGRR